MTTFDKREEAFETRYALDEALHFKARARRNKLLGLWVAETMGLSGGDAETYAKSLVVADLEEAGDDDVIRKVLADLTAAGIVKSDHQIRRALDGFLAEAVKQIAAAG